MVWYGRVRAREAQRSWRGADHGGGEDTSLVSHRQNLLVGPIGVWASGVGSVSRFGEHHLEILSEKEDGLRFFSFSLASICLNSTIKTCLHTSMNALSKAQSLHSHSKLDEHNSQILEIWMIEQEI